MDADDEASTNICRVCRCEGSDEQPLFYPCLCSGSIKYIHQECLVEWLKHSRKKYCELCKHKFSFTPSKKISSFIEFHSALVYKEQMPKRMPVMLLIRGLAAQALSVLQVTCRLVLVGLVWIVVVPWLTSSVFRFYFGWSAPEIALGTSKTPGWLVRGCLDCLLGLSITSGMVLLIFALMLLKDYLVGQVIPNLPRPRQRRGDNSTNNQQPQQQDGEDSTPRPYNWREHVTSREYRSYIRRQALHWERETQELARRTEERLRRRESATGTAEETTESITTSTVNPLGLVTPSSPAPSIGRSETTLRASTYMRPPSLGDLRRGRQSETNSNNNAIPSTPPTTIGNGNFVVNGVTFRDDIRCRICQSRTCVNTDHVVQASQRQLEERQRRRAAAADTIVAEANEATVAETATEAAPTDAPAEVPPLPAVEAVDNNPLFAFGIDVGPDPDTATLSVRSFLGFTGSMTNLAHNGAVVLICNLVMMHSAIFIPSILGEWVLGGGLVRLAGRLVRGLAVALAGKHVEFSYEWPFEQGNFATCLFVGHCCLYALMNVYVWVGARYGLRRRLITRSLYQWTLFLCAFFRLAAVLTTELVILPVAIGWVADLVAVSVGGGGFFDMANIHDRITFTHAYPAISCFLHWLGGVMIAVFVSFFVRSLRHHLRAGLLHFISNPNDPDHRPIKDIVERSIVAQLVRMTTSLVVYSAFVLVVLGGFIKITRALVPWMLPLRLVKLGRYSSGGFMFSGLIFYEGPLDVLLQLFLKAFVDWLSPSLVLGSLFQIYMRLLTRTLRISSYFWGGRFVDEESFPRGGKWAWVPDFDRHIPRERLAEMAKRPVDPLDIARLPVVVKGRGLPIADFFDHPMPRRAILPSTVSNRRQGATTRGFTVVFRPNYLGLRVCLFVLGLWAWLMASGLALIVAPLWIGRKVLSLVQEFLVRAFEEEGALPSVNDVHEFYKMVLGLIIMGCVVKLVVSIVKFWLEQDGKEIGRILYSLCITWPLRLAKMVFVAAVILVLFPILLGGHLFLIFSPLILHFYNSMVPKSETATILSTISAPLVALLVVWSGGMPLLQMIWQFRQYLFDAERVAAMELLRKGWNVPLWPLLSRLIIPLLRDQLILLVGPPILAGLLGGALMDDAGDDPLGGMDLVLKMQQWSFGAVVLGLLLIKLISWIYAAHVTMIQRIRDDAYLVGRQLKNHERPGTKLPDSSAAIATGTEEPQTPSTPVTSQRIVRRPVAASVS